MRYVFMAWQAVYVKRLRKPVYVFFGLLVGVKEVYKALLLNDIDFYFQLKTSKGEGD